MEITDMEVFHLSVPYIPEVQKHMHRALHPTIVRVHTDEVDGIGGGSHETEWTPMERLLKEFLKLKGKDPLKLDLRRVTYPFNVALYDIVGKRLGVPISYLLGGQVRDKVPLAYWTHALATPEETASEAVAAVKSGFKVLKWHSSPKPEMTVKKAKAIHDAVGDRLAIRIDMKYEENVLWDFATTLKIARKVREYNIECLEDPLPLPRNPELHRLLRLKVDIPLAWHTSNPKEVLKAVRHEACDYINIDRCRDINLGLKAAAVASIAGKPVWTATSGGSTGVNYVFGLHLASVIENATLPSDGVFMLQEDFVKEPLPSIAEGFSEVPRGPGLGVELDENAIEAYVAREFDQ